jgi:entericidin B
MARKVVIAVMAGLFALTATACNTVKGAGKDAEKAGEAIQRESTEHGAD